MLDFIKYGLFYNKLTEGRIFVFTLLSLFSAGCETLFIMSMLPVLEWGQKSPGRFSTYIYSLLNEYNISDNNSVLLCLLGVATICIMFASVGTIATKLYVAGLQAFLLKKVQMDVCPKLFNSSYKHVISKSTGYLNNAVMQQVPNTAYAFKHYSAIIGGGILTSVYLAIPVIKNPMMIGLLFILLSPALFILKAFNAKNRHYSILNAKRFASFNSALLQILTNFKYLKATSMVDLAMTKIQKEVDDIAFVMKKMAIWGGACNDVVKPYAMLVMFGMLYYSVAFNHIPLMEAGAMFGLLYMAYQKSVVIPMAYQKFLAATGAIQVFEAIMQDTNDNPDQYMMSDASNEQPDFSGNLELQNISFSYAPQMPPALNDVSISIPFLKTVAIVGESGSGKSTLVNLLTALFKPDSGKIALAGKEYIHLNIGDLRRNIGYITQEPVIFNDTVKNNITLWKCDANDEDVIAVAKKTHAHEFIMNMVNGYDTILGDNGVNISGGQRQRLTIARELFRQPQMLIFDEATSSLDSKTEEGIQKEIDALRGERTIIIIAHRLSTIKNCDIVYVLDKGKVVEQGGYDELISQNGLFNEMVARQAL